MFSTGLKQSLTLALIMAALAGCSSTSTTDEDAAAEAAARAEAARAAAAASRNTMQDQAPALDTVFYFGFDQSSLTAEARATLTAHAAQLNAEPRSVRLEGHTDERGPREYNMALGERRAKAIRDFLVLHGVDASQLETVSYGEEYPAVVGSNESAYSQNRRVDLK